jgi:hypothetical protein
MDFGLDPNLHGLMVEGMEFDFVDSISKSIMSAKHGRVRIGQTAPLDRLGAAGDFPHSAALILAPAPALSLKGLG